MAEGSVDELDAGDGVLGFGLLGIHVGLAQVVLNALNRVERVGTITQPVRENAGY